MKKSINILTICFLMLFSTAQANDKGTDKTLSQVKSKYENVKVYEQASTSTELVAVLKKDETISYLRKCVLNGGGWSIVYINGKPGYVLTSEIYDDPKFEVRNKKKKTKKTKNAKNEMLSKVKP